MARMPNPAARGALVAVALLATAGAAHSADPENKPEQAQQPAEKPQAEAPEAEPFPISIPGGIELKETPAAQVRESTDAQRARDDLWAQEAMAVAAIAQATLSFLALF